MVLLSQCSIILTWSEAVTLRLFMSSCSHLYFAPFLRPEQKQLVDSGPYGLVRHPMYTTVMLGIWITPTLVGISCLHLRGEDWYWSSLLQLKCWHIVPSRCYQMLNLEVMRSNCVVFSPLLIHVVFMQFVPWLQIWQLSEQTRLAYVVK